MATEKLKEIIQLLFITVLSRMISDHNLPGIVS